VQPLKVIQNRHSFTGALAVEDSKFRMRSAVAASSIPKNGFVKLL
jgi:hypothetical protein